MLRAYSYRDIQMIAQLLEVCSAARKSLEQCRAEVKASLAEREERAGLAVTPSDDRLGGKCPTVRTDGSDCPGQLTRCPAIDGVIIMRCHSCGYSEVR